MDAWPHYTRFALRLLPHTKAVLPSFWASELRGLLIQGLAAIGAPAEVPERPASFVVLPKRLGAPELPLEAQVTVAAGQPLEADLLAFGPPAERLRDLSRALDWAGARPFLGREGQRTTFSAMFSGTSGPASDGADPFVPHPLHAPPPPLHLLGRAAALARARTIELSTVTPVALRRGKGQAVDLADLTPLLQSLNARVTGLVECFGAHPDPVCVPLPPVGADDVVVCATESRVVGFARRGRGDRVTPTEGVVGKAVVEVRSLAAALWLALGEQVCVGRWTQFGMGQYCLWPVLARKEGVG